jgi:hypothetical protein
MYTALRLLILFGKTSIGCVNSPYITYRKLANDKTDARLVVFILLLVILYFAFASLVRTGMHNPYLLTLKFNTLIFGAGIGFMGMIFVLFALGRILDNVTTFKTLFILWSFTLLPTLMWFFFTSFFYLILPPPRTLSILGKLFTLWFVFFTGAVFFWKIILYYLTLRFGLRFDLFKIAAVSLIISPLIVSYSVAMYRLGIFRIPFL